MRLQPVNFKLQAEMTELIRQRRLCGWGEDTIGSWLKLLDAGDRLMWWIFLDDNDPPADWDVEEVHNFVLPDKSNLVLPPQNRDFMPIGHIALDYSDYRNDPEVANRETGTMVIATFFILKSQQSKGYGRKAMDEIERAAKEKHGCKTLTLNTIAAKCMTDPIWRRENDLGERTDDGRVNEHWYLRRGYKIWKEKPMYPWTKEDGSELLLPAVFMRKNL